MRARRVGTVFLLVLLVLVLSLFVLVLVDEEVLHAVVSHEHSRPRVVVRKVVMDGSQQSLNNVETDGGGAFPTLSAPLTNSKESNGDSFLDECEVIHIAIVCVGYSRVLQFRTMFKSILMHRTSPFHLHIITDDKTQAVLKTALLSWNLPHLYLSFYNGNNHLHEISWIHNRHYSGQFPLLKLLLTQILSNTIPKVISLDIDLLFRDDIKKLWSLFNKFAPDELIGIVENQSDWYSSPGMVVDNPWPAPGPRGVNTGLMLLHLQKMRERNWKNVWSDTVRAVFDNPKLNIDGTDLADQDVINAVLKEHPSWSLYLSCVWNFQLSDHSDALATCAAPLARVLHWNTHFKNDEGSNSEREDPYALLNFNDLRNKVYGDDVYQMGVASNGKENNNNNNILQNKPINFGRNDDDGQHNLEERLQRLVLARIRTTVISMDAEALSMVFPLQCDFNHIKNTVVDTMGSPPNSLHMRKLLRESKPSSPQQPINDNNPSQQQQQKQPSLTQLKKASRMKKKSNIVVDDFASSRLLKPPIKPSRCSPWSVDFDGTNNQKSSKRFPSSCPMEYMRAATMKPILHPYVLDYDHSLDLHSSTTLITHFTDERLSSFLAIAMAWKGPISAAVYASDRMLPSIIQKIRAHIASDKSFGGGSNEVLEKEDLDGKLVLSVHNIALHVVLHQSSPLLPHDYYPVNKLRNIAITYCRTPYYFHVDVDFRLSPSIFDHIERHIHAISIGEMEFEEDGNEEWLDTHNIALVVPAFESSDYSENIPHSKQQLVNAMNNNQIRPFRIEEWRAGHAPTDYNRWTGEDIVYSVSHVEGYEPYLVLPYNAPCFDERFVGFGWNKVSHVEELAARDYRFFVLPDVYIVHYPHHPSTSLISFRTQPQLRQCVATLLDIFREELPPKRKS
eukprot:m.139783 g.139783  ORF g.139783 m.139783 type:complete len:902 (+) comp24558_c0_seq1:59-2764(+)